MTINLSDRLLIRQQDKLLCILFWCGGDDFLKESVAVKFFVERRWPEAQKKNKELPKVIGH